MVCSWEYINYDRNQDTKSSPWSTCRKCDHSTDYKDDSRQEIHQSARGALNNSIYEIRCTQAVCHGFQCPCKSKDQDCRYHCFKSIRDTCHAVFEIHNAAYQIEYNCDHKYKEASQYKSNRSITLWKSSYKISSAKEPTSIDHTNNTAYYKADDRNQKINHLATWITLLILGRVCIRTCRCCINITF